MKSLVVFYSLTGKTRLAAQTVAKETQADLAEIEEVKPRKMGPGTYLSGGMDARKGKASEIKPLPANIDQYSRIFIGSPIWGSRCAPAINSFVDTANLRDKELVLFFTMGGSGQEGAIKFLTERIEKHSGKVTNSFALAIGKDTDQAIIARTKEALARYQR